MKILKLQKTISIIVISIIILILATIPLTIWLAKRAQKLRVQNYNQPFLQTAGGMLGGNVQPVQQIPVQQVPVQQVQQIPVQPVQDTTPQVDLTTANLDTVI